MDVQIKKANICDSEQINKIEQTLEHRILSYDLLNSTLDKNTYYYFVATINNIVVGYIAAELLVDHFDILSIAVLNEFRRQNIATMLLNQLFDICKEICISDIFLEVRCSNIPATRLYERLGFEKISIRKNYYTDTNESAYIYKKLV